MKRFFTLFCFLSALSCWINVANAQVVEIPDPNLAAAVREALRLGPNAPITKQKLRKLTQLTADSRGIEDLTGLEHATELKSLSLIGNGIRDVSPLAGLTKLKTLSLADNRIIGTGPLLTLLQKSPNLKLDISIPMDEHPPMYWLTGGRTPQLQYLRSVSATVETLWESSIPLASKVTALTVDTTGGVLFMTENVDDHFSEIWWVNLTGDPKVENLTSVVGVIRGITVDPKRRELYWTSSFQGRGGSISRLDLSKGEQGRQITLIQNLDAPGDITVDTEGNKLYWVEGTRIRRSDLNGKNIQDVVTTNNYSKGEFAIAIADRKIYWTQVEVDLANPLFPNFVGRILRANLDGSNVEEVERLGVEGLLSFVILQDIAVDVANKTLYYSQSHGPATHIVGVDLNNLAAASEIAVYSEAGIGPEQIALGAAVGDVDGASVVHVERSNRPPMYWIDAEVGALYRLIGDEVENLAPSVQNATSLAVDIPRGILYWTEKTSNTTGKIRRANLDGSNMQLVKDLTSVPLDLALDTGGGKLYLTNSYGKIQRLNLDGSNFQSNLITDLQNPNHLVLDAARGKVYWTEQIGKATGTLRRANLDGTDIQLVKELTSAPHGLAVDAVNQKLYLTNSWGKIQRLNFDGSNFQSNLITDLESPTGLAVDAVSGKLYWTETGSIRCANLNGENIQNVVTGLSAPASIVLSTPAVEVVVPAAPATVVIVPDETNLHPNYPNPFNPETWIPYQLAKPAEVMLHIYSVNGRLVRTLALGHQPAGMYQSRSRAVYWDGRNAVGEPVASGLYFYTFTAGDFTATRKMLIRK